MAVELIFTHSPIDLIHSFTHSPIDYRLIDLLMDRVSDEEVVFEFLSFWIVMFCGCLQTIIDIQPNLYLAFKIDI